jgi:hypothetical protein
MATVLGEEIHLGVENPRLTFREEPKHPDTWMGRRVLALDGVPAFELSFWCTTCGYLFERREGADNTLSLAELQDRLTAGVVGLDRDVIDSFAQVLSRGNYIPMLLTVTPHLIHPMREGDYFAEEQVVMWGLDGFTGLPQFPKTPYYRTFDAPMDATSHLFEFVVPMTPPTWDNSAQVSQFEQVLRTSSAPTAVALSTLDVCAPAEQRGDTWGTHWVLTHFLLDGHHKMHAAANTGRPLQLLCLLDTSAGLAEPEQVTRATKLRTAKA